MLGTDELRRVGRMAGLDAVGVTSAEPLVEHLLDEGLIGAEPGWRGDGRDLPGMRHPSAWLEGARSVISLSLGYLVEGGIEACAPDGPQGRTARYQWWDCLGEMDRKAAALMRHLESQGARCVMATGISERAVAARAGVGSFGKNSNIQTLDNGSWGLLRAIVTDARLDEDEPMAPRCGSCRRCMGVCPTKAIVAPYVVDRGRCIAGLLASPRPIPVQLRPAIGDRVSGCDACQEICPRNWYVVPKRIEGLPGPRPRSLPLADLLLHRVRFDALPHPPDGHAPKADQWRRNAAVALGNSGAEAALPSLLAAMRDPVAQVRSHSAWALGRIGGARAGGGLREALAREKDADVVQEISQALREMGR